jgi:hypothetical protein
MATRTSHVTANVGSPSAVVTGTVLDDGRWMGPGRTSEQVSLIPAERQTSRAIIEVVPEGVFLTYALGVPLRQMRDPAAAAARVAVSSHEGVSPHEGRTRSSGHAPSRGLGTRVTGPSESMSST